MNKKASSLNTAKDLLPFLARKKALFQPIGEHIYKVDDKWSADLIRNEQDVHVVTTISELKKNFEDPEVVSIFIPKQSAVTNEAMNAVIERSGLTKTIFVEF